MAQTRQHESVPCGAEAPVRGVEPGVQDLHVGGHVARLRGARRQGPRVARRQGRDRRFDRYAHRLLGPFQRHLQRERVALRHHPRRIPQQQLLPPDLRASGQGPHGADPRRCEVARLQHAHGHRGGFMPRRGGFAVPLRQLGPAHRRTEQCERQDALGQHHARGFQGPRRHAPAHGGHRQGGRGYTHPLERHPLERPHHQSVGPVHEPHGRRTRSAGSLLRRLSGVPGQQRRHRAGFRRTLRQRRDGDALENRGGLRPPARHARRRHGQGRRLRHARMLRLQQLGRPDLRRPQTLFPAGHGGVRPPQARRSPRYGGAPLFVRPNGPHDELHPDTSAVLRPLHAAGRHLLVGRIQDYRR